MTKIDMMIGTARTAEAFQIADGQPALRDWLVRGIGDRGSQRSRQHESRPKQQRAGDPGEEIENSNDGKHERDRKRAVVVT